MVDLQLLLDKLKYDHVSNFILVSYVLSIKMDKTFSVRLPLPTFYLSVLLKPLNDKLCSVHIRN